MSKNIDLPWPSIFLTEDCLYEEASAAYKLVTPVIDV